MAKHHSSNLFFCLTLSLLMFTTLSCQLCNSSQWIPKSSPPYSNTPALANNDDMIKSLCEHTDYLKLCISTIQCQLPIREQLDPATVLKLSMRAVRANSKAARSVASELLRDPKNKAATGPLKDCKELYDDVVYSIDKGNDAIEVHDKGTLGSMLSAVSTDIDTCNNGFDDLNLPNLVVKCDDLLAKLAHICLAIAHAASLT